MRIEKVKGVIVYFTNRLLKRMIKMKGMIKMKRNHPSATDKVQLIRWWWWTRLTMAIHSCQEYSNDYMSSIVPACHRTININQRNSVKMPTTSNIWL